jgi:heat shock protein HslJ
VKSAPPHEAYILFRPGEGGRLLGGTSGCNGLKGTYDTFAGRLRIDATVLTGRPCPAAVAAREPKLVEALKATANYRIAGNSLALQSADGRLLARFAAREKP